MSARRARPPARGLVMPPGRRIPRPADARPEKLPAPPPDPEALGTGALKLDLEKAGGELQALASEIRGCARCGPLDAPRAFGSGSPRAPLFLLKDVPSEADLQSGTAFTSEAEALGRAFERLAIPPAWVYGTTARHCGGPVTLDDLKDCATHLLVEVEAVGPRVLVAFGERALDAVRLLDGRCGLAVPGDVPAGTPTPLRRDLHLLVTEDLPAGLTAADAKRRLWRDLQAIPGLLRP